MNRWLFLAVSSMTLATVSLPAYCRTCGTQPGRGAQNYQSSGRYRQGPMKTYYTKNSNYRDRKDDKYVTAQDKQTLEEIHKALDAEKFDWDNNNVQVIVEYGKVVFRGRIAGEKEKEALNKASVDAPYVKNVVLDVYVDDINNVNAKPSMPNNFNQ